MERAKSRWWVAGVVSVAVHAGVFAGLVLRAPSAPPPSEAPTRVTLNFTVPAESETVPKVEAAPEPEARPAAPAPRRRTPRRPAKRAARTEPAPAAVTEAPAGDVDGTVAVSGEAAAPGPASVEPAPVVDLALHAQPTGPAVVPPGFVPPGVSTPQGTSSRRRLRLKPRADGGYEVKDSQFTADIAPDGAITFRDKSALDKWQGIAYEVDVTDVVMRAVGDDPYRYEKQRILRETAGLRAKLAKQACEARLEEALVNLRARLEATWGDLERTPEARRALLFSLWDDCAEDGDARQVATAREARRMVYEFINARLPEGSAHAYTAGELVALNERRRSKAVFRPY